MPDVHVRLAGAVVLAIVVLLVAILVAVNLGLYYYAQRTRGPVSRKKLGTKKEKRKAMRTGGGAPSVL